MTYIKIKDNLYPAMIEGKMVDREWDNRESKAITVEMDYNTAVTLFVNDIKWSIVEKNESVEDINWDNSEYCLAGDITDHRDGTITVKMLGGAL